MPVSYSNDLRWRIVWLHVFLQIAADEVARVMHVCKRTVCRYAERFRLTGEVWMSMKSHGPPGMLCEFKKLLLIQLILIRPGIYLRELQQELSDCTGNLVDISNICHEVRKMGMTRPKIQHIALQQSELKRAKFIAEMAVLDSSTIVWINKTGCDCVNALQKYGYGIRGLTPQDYQLKLRGGGNSIWRYFPRFC